MGQTSSLTRGDAPTVEGDATRTPARALGVVAVAAAATGEVARREAAPGAEAATAPAGGEGSDH